jgi:hypothetical protein
LKAIHESNDRLLALERSLKQELHPVQPDQKFIGSLQQRLEDSPEFQRNRRTAATLLSIAAGLIIGLAIFLIGRGFIENTDQA